MTAMRTCSVCLLLAAACGGSDEAVPATDTGLRLDAGQTRGDAGAPDCHSSPTTHLELLNACTDAEKIDKQPSLPLIRPNGALPTLP